MQSFMFCFSLHKSSFPSVLVFDAQANVAVTEEYRQNKATKSKKIQLAPPETAFA